MMARAEAAQELKERAVDARKAAVDAQDEPAGCAPRSRLASRPTRAAAAIGDFFKSATAPGPSAGTSAPIAGADDEPSVPAAEATGGAPGGPSPFKEVTVMQDDAPPAAYAGADAAREHGARAAPRRRSTAEAPTVGSRSTRSPRGRRRGRAAGRGQAAPPRPDGAARATCDATVAVAQWATWARARSR